MIFHRFMRLAARIATALALSASTRAATWTGAGDGTNWSDGNNWDVLTPPNGGNAIIFKDGADVHLTSSTNTCYELALGNTGSVVTLTIEAPAGQTALSTGFFMHIGYGSNSRGTVNQVSGNVSFSSQRCIIGGGGGYNTKGEGVYNISGGNLSGRWIHIGEDYRGLLNQTGGSVTPSRNVYIGADTSPGAEYRISGGTMAFPSSYTHYLGGNGILRIIGSAPASIGTGPLSITTNTALLAYELDATGVTPVVVSGALALNGTLDVTLNGYTGSGPVTLLQYGTRSGAFTATNFNSFSADLDYVTDNKVRLLNIRGLRPKGAVMLMR